MNSDLVPGPLDGVLYNRGERLESAEWDFLLWGVSLESKCKKVCRNSVLRAKE